MKIIAGNWKMNGTRADLDKMVAAIDAEKPENRVILCVPFTMLRHGTDSVAIGAQDVSTHARGAYTGEVSGAMIADTGAKYVIVGHSDRRLYHNETNELVKEKATIAIKNGIIPIICVGETIEEKNSGHTTSVIKKMLLESIPEDGEYIIAYEPRWAIGSGLTPTNNEIVTAVKTIFDNLPNPMPILYGGSVNQDNALDIATIPYIDGLLIGGASLKTKTFLPIIDSIS